MALSSTIVWEIRSGSNDNNGGGYKTGASGTDWSQQTSPQYALTGVTAVGSGATFQTTSAAADMVGNIAHVVSGTLFTPGFYEIISVNVGTDVTCDATLVTGAGTSGVVNIGGALASLAPIVSASANQGAVAGNVIHVKGSIASTTSAITFAASGTATDPIVIKGYGTTRNDGDDLGRTNGYGPLITTNFATFTYTSTGRLAISGNFVIFETIKIVSAPSNAALSNAGNDCLMRMIDVNNSSTNASAAGISVGTRSSLIDSDITMSGASGGSYGVTAGAASVAVDSCRIKIVSPTVPGVLVSSSAIVIGNTIFGPNTGTGGGTGHGISMNSASGSPNIRSNTIFGFRDNAIEIISTATAQQRIIGNMITDNVGFGIDANAVTVQVVQAYNRFRDNVAGNTNSGTNWIAATGYGNVTTDTGGPETDYIASSTGDFRLVSTSPAKGVGLLPFSDIGALQRREPHGGFLAV